MVDNLGWLNERIQWQMINIHEKKIFGIFTSLITKDLGCMLLSLIHKEGHIYNVLTWDVSIWFSKNRWLFGSLHLDNNFLAMLRKHNARYNDDKERPKTSVSAFQFVIVENLLSVRWIYWMVGNSLPTWVAIIYLNNLVLVHLFSTSHQVDSDL